MKRRLTAMLLTGSICLGCLAGCVGVLQRGMLGDAYVSTARPAIMAQANNMPLLAAGSGICNLQWTSVIGGMPIDVWLAVYGEGGLAPLAIVAQAQTPADCIWEPTMFVPGSVDAGTEVLNGVGYQACTFVIDPGKDPFGGFVTGVQADGAPQLWLVRSFVADFNFQNDRIILQYREPLPQGITSLTALPLGQSDLLARFAQNARDAFSVGNAPQNPAGIVASHIKGIRWQYMGQSFLGQASRDSLFMDSVW